MIIFYIYSFILGLVLGSFYNVVGLRVPKNESIVNPPSHCPQCGRRLTFIDMIPFFSYLFLRGKCRACGSKISIVYPVIELATGLLFFYMFYHFGLTSETIMGWAIVSLLVIIFVSDISYMLIPDKVLLAFLIIFIGLRLWQPLHPWWDSLVGLAVGFLLLYLIAIISRGGMGGGDIKLFGLLGLFMGWRLILLAFFLSTAFGAVIGIIGLLMGWVKRGKPMPFGPYIVLGTLTAFLYGHTLITWYMQLIQ